MVRCLTAARFMRADSVVDFDVPPYLFLSFGHGFVILQVNFIPFQRPPEPLDGQVVECPAFPIHTDFYPGILEHADVSGACELRSLIRIKDFRMAVFFKRLFQSFQTEEPIHGVGEPPGEYVL